MLYLSILSYILEIGIKLSDEEISLLKSKIKVIKINKGEIISNDELKNKKLFFVNKGIIIAYHLDIEGNIKPSMVSWENKFMINIHGFENNNEVIECLENAEVLYITRKDAEQLIMYSPNFVKLFISIYENHMIMYAKKIDFIGYGIRNKIEFLIKEYRPLIGRVKDSFIASLLNISRRNFLRYKKNINP